MRILLIFLAGMLAGTLSAQAPAAPATFGAQMHQKWQNSTAYLLEALAATPDTAYAFRPTPDQMTFEEQLRHNLLHMTTFSQRFLGAAPFGALDTLVAATDSLQLTKAEWLTLTRRACDFADAAMQAVPPTAYTEPVTFFAGPMNKQQIITLLHDHLTHHRAQMLVYMRLIGAQPPRYRGW